MKDGVYSLRMDFFKRRPNNQPNKQAILPSQLWFPPCQMNATGRVVIYPSSHTMRTYGPVQKFQFFVHIPISSVSQVK